MQLFPLDRNLIQNNLLLEHICSIQIYLKYIAQKYFHQREALIAYKIFYKNTEWNHCLYPSS